MEYLANISSITLAQLILVTQVCNKVQNCKGRGYKNWNITSKGHSMRHLVQSCSSVHTQMRMGVGRTKLLCTSIFFYICSGAAASTKGPQATEKNKFYHHYKKKAKPRKLLHLNDLTLKREPGECEAIAFIFNSFQKSKQILKNSSTC